MTFFQIHFHFSISYGILFHQLRIWLEKQASAHLWLSLWKSLKTKSMTVYPTWSWTPDFLKISSSLILQPNKNLQHGIVLLRNLCCSINLIKLLATISHYFQFNRGSEGAKHQRSSMMGNFTSKKVYFNEMRKFHIDLQSPELLLYKKHGFLYFVYVGCSTSLSHIYGLPSKFCAL